MRLNSTTAIKIVHQIITLKGETAKLTVGMRGTGLDVGQGPVSSNGERQHLDGVIGELPQVLQDGGEGVDSSDFGKSRRLVAHQVFTRILTWVGRVDDLVSVDDAVLEVLFRRMPRYLNGRGSESHTMQLFRTSTRDCKDFNVCKILHERRPENEYTFCVYVIPLDLQDLQRDTHNAQEETYIAEFTLNPRVCLVVGIQ